MKARQKIDQKTDQKKDAKKTSKKPPAKDRYKTVFITGASSGIGESTARLFAKRGYALILTARRMDRLKKLQVLCEKLGSPTVQVFKLDVTDRQAVQRLSRSLKSRNCFIDILINNAGLAKGVEPFQNSKPEDWDEMINTNVTGVLNITRVFMADLIKNQGHVLNLGSVAGRLVYEGGSVYCASKFAVRAISEALRLDLKGTGVRVSSVSPGMVQTEFSVVRLGNQQKADAIYADMLPLTSEDIAASVLWCVSQPRHVNISEIIIYPTDQASVGHVVRGEKSVKNLLNGVKDVS